MAILLLLTPVLLFATAFADLEEILQPTTRDIPMLDECGFEKVDKVIGGTETKAGEFPWLAALEYNEKGTQNSKGIKCGGSVVNRRYVLTAGHCLFPANYDLVKVWLGVWKISTADTTDKDKVKKFGLQEKILHPLYNAAARTNDIGLLKLDDEIAYTTYIRPICLPKPDLDLPPYGTKLTVAGWGRTENASGSDIKLKVDIPVMENSVCERKLQITMHDTQMCAGSEAGKDSCFGDSGGPLMRNATNPPTGKVHWFPHGIVSFGVNPCGKPNTPGVYTRVSKFMNWILSIISNDP